MWLDIVGDIPSPEHVTAFLLDPAKDKREQGRQRVAEESAVRPELGPLLARCHPLSQVGRSRPASSRIRSSSHLTERFNDNEPWSKIAAEFITSAGDIRENGMTAIHAAQDARTEETAAEMSRIFLGIQIQCCQCHDHPYDHWKREQFHEFAAFFPRLAMQPIVDADAAQL